MIRALWNGASAINAQRLNLDIIAENVANINTNSYKKRKVNFADLLYQSVSQLGNQMASKTVESLMQDNYRNAFLKEGTGARLIFTGKVFSQGSLEQTGKPLDVAIDGQGFFKALSPAGEEFYTRNGNFRLDGEGNLITPAGFVVFPGLKLPPDYQMVSFGQDGKVRVTDSSGNCIEVGSMAIYKFSRPEVLQSLGVGYYIPSEASGVAEDVKLNEDNTDNLNENINLRQGYLELSNVDLIEEMAALIVSQRAYQFGSRSIIVANEMWVLANNDRK